MYFIFSLLINMSLKLMLGAVHEQQNLHIHTKKKNVWEGGYVQNKDIWSRKTEQKDRAAARTIFSWRKS